MIRNYLLIALRNLSKYRTYTFINISGLAVGIAASLLILLFVAHEFSFDHFHTNGKQIYRVLGKVNYGGQEVQMNALSAQFGPVIKESTPDILNYVRVRNPGRVVIKTDEQHKFFEDSFLFADASLFDVFTFPMVKGDRASLSRPGTVVISEQIAHTYFGNADPIGKTITYNRENILEIVGVAANPSSNSTIVFDFVASFPTLGTIESEKHQYLHEKISLGAYNTYFLLRENAEVAKIESTIPKIAKTSIDEKYLLEPFLGIHLGNNFGDFANTRYLYIFSGVAILILALALINYMNLTTARATVRAREVGIRKVIGAKRSALSLQFYFESALMTLIAFALAVVMVQLMLPVFLNVLETKIDTHFITSPVFAGLAGLLFLVCVILSGSYPAIVLSRFAPAEILKGKAGNTGGAWVRKSFTVFQFTVSVALIICSLVVGHQLDYLRNKKIGLNKDQVMVLSLEPSLRPHYAKFKQDIRQQTGVLAVSASSMPMYTNGVSMYFTKTPTTNEDVTVCVMSVDDSFLKTLGIEWKEKPEDTELTGNYIINEQAVGKLKLTDNVIGQKLSLGRDDGKITGVVKDFNFTSLREKLDGLVITVERDTASEIIQYGGALYVRVDPKANLHDKIASIKALYDQYESETPFEYYFLDDAFNKLYKGEDRLARVFQAFTGIAICIACLGLLGLVTFTAELKTKEIGIRKILGATVRSILLLLSRDFILLLFISIVLASPLAWYAMHKWLEEFTYRTEIPLWFFAAAGGAAGMVALITVLYQAIKAAQSNPVDSLRND